MHVGLNLLFLVPGSTGGTEVYARELIPELVAAGWEANFTAFVNREAAAVNDAPWGNLIPAVTVPVSASSRLQWVGGEQALLPRMAARAGVDVLHSLANTAPATGSFRRIVTIHDLHYRLVPEAHLGIRGLGMRVLVPLAAHRSDRIITDAASTRQDVHTLLRVPLRKIDAVPAGSGGRPAVKPVGEPELRRSLLDGDPRPIVLSVSAKRPHKNIARVIEAIALIPAERRPILVAPGYPTAYEEELRRCVTRLAVSSDVRLLGWITPAELEGLYAAAACLVCASLHEGFGLPVLEAMTRGVPVACSARGALEEVAGDAALRFDPESPAEIAASIERLVTDRAEADRLRAAGRLRAGQFTWAATAAGTLRTYERALGSGS